MTSCAAQRPQAGNQESVRRCCLKAAAQVQAAPSQVAAVSFFFPKASWMLGWGGCMGKGCHLVFLSGDCKAGPVLTGGQGAAMQSLAQKSQAERV